MSLLDKLSPAARAQVEEQLKKPAPKGAGSSSVPHNKFNVAQKEDRTVDGVVLDSKLEARVWKRLKLLIDPARIQRQVEFEICPKQIGPTGTKYRNASYRADFVVDGKYVLDAKGQILPEYRLKKKLVLHLHKVEIIELRNLRDTDAFVASLPPA